MSKRIKVALISLYGVENIGIRILSAVLKKQDAEVKVYFFKKWKNNNITLPTAREIEIVINGLRTFAPAIIGIGFGSPYLRIAIDLTQELRRAVSSFIVWGGIHATVCPEDCIEYADAVCIGEGEYPLSELVSAIGRGQAYDGIQNFWVRHSNGVKRNPLRNLIQNLDALPYPDYGPADKYLIEYGRCVVGEPLRQSAELRVCASRGCFFNCSYCYNSTLREIYEGKGKYFRQHSVQYIIGLLAYATRLLRVRRVKFDDDTFMSDPAWVREFSEAYRANIGIAFDVLVHPSLLKEAPLRDLKSAGLVKVQTGIESASDRESEQLYNRATNNDGVRAFSKINSKLKVGVVYDIIMDNPLARFEDKQRLLFLLLSLERPFDIFMYSLTVFPKTGLARRFLDQGLITPDDIEGRAEKSFRQFRLSFDYCRGPEDKFFISLISLTSKNFVPRFFVRIFFKSAYLRKHPCMLEYISQAANVIKVAVIAWKMILNGEMTAMKFREYASVRKLIIQ